MRPGWLRAKIGADHFCEVLDVTELVEYDVRRCSFSDRRSKYHSRAVGDRRILRQAAQATEAPPAPLWLTNYRAVHR